MVDRRRLLQLGLGGAAPLLASQGQAQRFVTEQPLKPGELTWEPERSPPP
jgi:hypothetical protein